MIDFPLEIPETESWILAQTDLLVEAGIPRHIAEKAVTKISDILDNEFTAFIEAAYDSDLEVRAFMRSCLIAWLFEWVTDRMVMAHKVQLMILAKYQSE